MGGRSVSRNGVDTDYVGGVAILRLRFYAPYCDFVSMLPGNSVEGRDGEQAYLQAKMEGPTTDIQLTKVPWTPEVHSMRCPVVLLEKALYVQKTADRIGKSCVTSNARVWASCCLAKFVHAFTGTSV